MTQNFYYLRHLLYLYISDYQSFTRNLYTTKV